MESKLARMQELVALLNNYAHAYYTKDAPIVSDAQYDALYDELLQLEKESGHVLSDSPTQRVGDQISQGFQKHRHISPLWSLDKANSFDELRAWDQRNQRLLEQETPIDYIVTMKFDGLTINLTYEGGRLIAAATRGTGIVGEFILPQIRTIQDVPSLISSEGLFEIRGEAVMTREAFEQYNVLAPIPLKNLRNAAAGALRNLDVEETRRRNLSTFFYDIGYYEGIDFKTYRDILDFLKDQGFRVHSHMTYCQNIEEVILAVEAIGAQRSQLNFEIDGAVVAVNDLQLRSKLGYTVKAPRWSIAYKFEAVEATTLLKEVQWNVGRTGKVTPTALLEPVELAGATVQRATLNNLDDIRRKGLQLGKMVFIRRSNDVIPEILGVVDPEEEGKEIQAPEVCPECATPLIQEGAHLFCPNSIGCKPQMVKAIVHFSSREAMNIEGLSEKTARQLFEVLDVRGVEDIYYLSAQDLSVLDKFKEKKIANLLQAIDKSKEPSLSAFIYALGIPQVGKKTARDLAMVFGSLEHMMGKNAEEFEKIPEIGPIVAHHLAAFFSSASALAAIERLKAAGVRPLQESNSSGKKSRLAGKQIVVTGTLAGFNRQEIHNRLVAYGAEVKDSVGKNTDVLIAGDNPGSKLEKARVLREREGSRPEIWTEQDWLRFIEEEL